MPSVNELAAAATAAAGAGNMQEAERLWQEVRRLEPRHVPALSSLGIHAAQRGDFGLAVQWLEAARAVAPNDPMLALTLASIWRAKGDPAAELAAIDASLEIEPYFLPGVLAKAAWHERQGNGATAAMFYRNAVRIAPPDARLPEPLRLQLQHARRESDRAAAAMEQHLSVQLQATLSGLSAAEAERWREAIAIRAGRTRPYNAEASQVHVPRLAPIPFFDRAEFAWAPKFEAKTEAITAELNALLAQGREGFTPYVSTKPGEPTNQWAELNNSERWSTFHLYRHGEVIEANAARCPQTMMALREVGLPEVPGYCPNVMFSALAPHTHIPPHHGESNIRVIAHLPLIVPPHCTYRVGFEHRQWEVAKLLIFDDTIEHEARNDSDELRVVLIFDVWHPHLSDAEKEVARRLTVEAQRFVLPQAT